MRTLLIVVALAAALLLAFAFVRAALLVSELSGGWPNSATLCVPGGDGSASISPAPNVYARLDLSTHLACPMMECETNDMLEPVLRATLTIETDVGRSTEEVGVTSGAHCTTFELPVER